MLIHLKRSNELPSLKKYIGLYYGKYFYRKYVKKKLKSNLLCCECFVRINPNKSDHNLEQENEILAEKFSWEI